ncbi:MAG TPA: phosphoenolpyruvate--protein phosphotransferase [Pusillimonas sp.]|jgi:phosphotransferase system enzyme I (PtsI)|nr:phosphoenolpyruvate--protein phosphotransferase [Pusillimonas sp.]MBC41822.1 phosphoenolpyruvate--protein phosphotransferase [Pusillimonas sp.]HBT32954.1 phosphoenolpyruvate--protein phosphotransferase [Pusillimonas sp.]HCN71750.1 phosphoenolpyruvate--protein phosphotransferase [Pusillimonas sp.]HCP76797.1 phosphoenolpyruvate--protein phosphotransferase [Pusillimonas sp.]
MTVAASAVPYRFSSMLCLRGQGVVKGYAIGRAAVMGAAALEVVHYRIQPDAVDEECARLKAALAQARDELQYMVANLPDDAPREMGALLTVHSMLLDDRMLSEQACNLIIERHYNAEWALTTQGQALGEQFAAMEDEYLRERGTDIRQVIERVLRVLSGTPVALPQFDSGYSGELIVVARDISPADMLRLRGARFGAFLTDLGGPTSHTAIVARSMNVPAVVGMGNIRALVRDGDLLIVDGMSGAVLVNPPDFVLQEYRRRQAVYADDRAELGRLKDAEAVTLDGVQVKLEANIELPEEAEQALAAGADGIGLFRSEFLFMGRRDLPGEEEQYEAYATVVKAMQGRPVTIRTLDIGADKTLDGDATVATNPALGLRAIRYCLAHPEIFQTQLRALLRASAHGKLRILVPMIAHLHEVRAVRQAIAEACQNLESRDLFFDRNIEVGAMVEIPAIAIAIEPFVEQLDFLSIGTNDLIQYTLAIDRGDNDVADLYDPMHPAVLRLISHTINAAQRYGKSVAVCGEMAGDAQVTRMLLGLGLREFSMHPQQLLDVKKEVRQSHTNALRVKVASALNRAERINLDDLAG